MHFFRKALRTAGLVLVSESVGNMLGGRQQLKLWSSRSGPPPYRALVHRFGKDLRVLYRVSAAELAAGLGLLKLSRVGR